MDARDFTLVLEDGPALAAVRELTEVLQQEIDELWGDLDARFLLGWLHWYRYNALPEGEDRQDLAASIAMFLPCFITGTTDAPEPLLPILATEAVPTATAWLQNELAGSGEQNLLVDAARLWRLIADATPAADPDRAERLSNLGTALRARFERAGDPADLDDAVQAGRQAAETVPVGHPDHVAILINLGNALRTRFEETGVVSDLDAAVQAGRQAVEGTPPEHSDLAIRLSNLGSTLRVRFARTADMGALDEAIRMEQQAGDIVPIDHPQRAAILHNLGIARWARFGRAGLQDDLHAAIEAAQLAVDATPIGYPAHGLYLTQLGGALRTRFERTGDVDDLDAAVRTCRLAADVTPGGHRDRAGRLGNLGGALLARFERAGAQADLEAALQAAREALDATPADHPDRAGRLSGLGHVLSARFKRTGDARHLDAAVHAYRRAVDATPSDHPDRAGRLSSLGNALKARAERIGDQRDFDAAVLVGRQAVEAVPADHPDRAGMLSNLGNTLESRFERTGKASDLDAAVLAGRQAVELVPADHPDRAGMLSNLGSALRTRFGRTGDAGDRDAAFAAYAQAAGVYTAAPSARVHTGRAAASLAMVGSQPEQASNLLENIVRLLPEVAPRDLERTDRQYAISAFAGLATEAAAAALSALTTPADQRPVRALRLLEGARAVLLSQSLHTRSDLTDLRQRHPELARDFARLRDLLDRPPGSLSPATETPAMPLVAPLATASPGEAAPGTRRFPRARDRRYAAAELTRLLARIRALDGFSTFALPPTTEQLLAQAAGGPVVVFNIDRRRSDALLLTGAGVTALELPTLAHDEVIDRIVTFRRALDAATDTDANRVGAQAEVREILGWLWDTAAEPVLDALGHHRPPAFGQEWPRVWWAPGGLLSLLPIHAAGHHSTTPDPGHRAVMDRVVSSYTPTVGALAHARRNTITPRRTDRSLIVAMPTTPGLPDQGRLAKVSAEVDMLHTRLTRPVLLVEPDGDTWSDRPVPTKASVLQNLADCAIAHFACHGHNDPVDPSRSRLLLHDHLEDPLTVAALEPLSLDDARLAYLSACSTAFTSRTDLLDEAIHLASAFQLAGFPHVIGTMWPIDDEAAVTIAADFYATLRNGDGVLDVSRAAHALHHAVRAARDTYPVTPTLWAAHIHAGA